MSVTYYHLFITTKKSISSENMSTFGVDICWRGSPGKLDQEFWPVNVVDEGLPENTLSSGHIKWTATLVYWSMGTGSLGVLFVDIFLDIVSDLFLDLV